jgi:hypothetical protein
VGGVHGGQVGAVEAVQVARVVGPTPTPTVLLNLHVSTLHGNPVTCGGAGRRR